MIEVIINNTKKCSFKWFIKDNTYIKGYAYINNAYLEGKSLLDYFLNIDDKTNLKNLLAEINGVFQIIIKSEDSIFAAVDKFGSYDLFYALKGENLIVSDSVKIISNQTGYKKINENGKKDFIYSGFILNGETLIENIFSIKAAQCLTFKTSIKLEKYYSTKFNVKKYNSYNEIKKEFDEVVHKVAKRLVASLKGQEVYIPLSGGADSRFMLLLLNKMNYKNVTCFSYGSFILGERKYAKKLAHNSGFKYIDMPYKRRNWKNLFKHKNNIEYFKYASNYQCMSHLFDYFAANKIAKKDYIVIPGHFGSVTENQFSDILSKKEVIKFFIKKYMFFYNDNEIKNYLYKRVSNSFSGYNEKSNIYEQLKVFDDTAYETYRSKHILKALKPYEINSFKWRLPLVDNDIIKFFNSLDIKYKGSEKVFFKRYISERISSEVPFYKSSKNYFMKAFKNIFDRKYSCIKPFDIFKLKYEDVYLPKKIKLLYRFYRNVYSYITIKNFNIIEKDINES